MYKIIRNIMILVFFTAIISCDDAESQDQGALKYVIINNSENIIDKIYFHNDYNNYKNKNNAIRISLLKRGDSRKICPVGDQYITFRRELSKTDPDTKIYVTSSIPLNYKKGIITIELGDADFYVTKTFNPANSCECAITNNIVPNCVTELDECKDNPCKNGGSCQLTELSYECNCPNNYEGANCETKINFCKDNPCLNDGICIDETYKYSCECADDYYGDNCDKKYIKCIDNPCLNDGTCTDEVHGYSCECLDGYEGANCEIEDICILANPCNIENTISCNKDETTGYKCICKAGYEGTTCDMSIDD